MPANKVLFALAWLLSACLRPSTDPGAIELPSRRANALPGGFYTQAAGIAGDYPAEGATQETMRRDLETARAAGIHWLRFGLAWDGAETSPGEYDFRIWDRLLALMPEYGVTPLPYVCYTPNWLSGGEHYWAIPPDPQLYGRFMEVVAKRYAGRVPSWELWNEPDSADSWRGSLEQYADLVRAGASGVHRGDPRARVVLGGMSKGASPFLVGLLRGEKIGAVVDVVSIHGSRDPRRAEEYLRAAADLVREAAPRNDLWMTGFGDDHGEKRTPASQATALLSAHALASSTGAFSLTAWHRIDGAGPAGGAFHALRLWNALFDGPIRALPAPAAGKAVVRIFEKTSGQLVVLAWLSGEPSPAGGRATVVRIPLPRAGRAMEQFDPLTGLPSIAPAVLNGAAIENVALQGDSIFVARISAPRP